jgi:hypothetical protein
MEPYLPGLSFASMLFSHPHLFQLLISCRLRLAARQLAQKAVKTNASARKIIQLRNISAKN